MSETESLQKEIDWLTEWNQRTLEWVEERVNDLPNREEQLNKLLISKGYIFGGLEEIKIKAQERIEHKRNYWKVKNKKKRTDPVYRVTENIKRNLRRGKLREEIGDDAYKEKVKLEVRASRAKNPEKSKADARIYQRKKRAIDKEESPYVETREKRSRKEQAEMLGISQSKLRRIITELNKKAKAEIKLTTEEQYYSDKLEEFKYK